MALFQILNPNLFTLDWLKTHGVRIAIIVALALLASKLGSIAARRFRRRLERTTDGVPPPSLYRTATLANTVVYVLRIAVWTVAVLMVLGELGFDLGPLLAGAGIAGIALGFGAQSLVRDFLAGFFILLEDQFGVGEAVELSVVGGTVTGRVESLTLRTTSVRTEDGTVSVIPNGNIQVASNRSRSPDPTL
jgi:small conductance mechanosensitive channel